MRKAIKSCILLGIVVMCLFPPWRIKGGASNSFLKVFKNKSGISYSFITHPPENSIGIDFQILLSQLVIAFILGKLYYNHYSHGRIFKHSGKMREHNYSPDRND